jgi:hypothetical protein
MRNRPAGMHLLLYLFSRRCRLRGFERAITSGETLDAVSSRIARLWIYRKDRAHQGAFDQL